jgi:hypothetical protein
MSSFDDPVRLSARLTKESKLRSALRAARATGPTEAELESLERRVLASVGAAAAMTGTAAVSAARASAAAAKVSTAVASSLSAGKVVVALMTVAAVGGGSGLVWRHAHPHPTARAAHTAPAVARGHASASHQPTDSRVPAEPNRDDPPGDLVWPERPPRPKPHVAVGARHAQSAPSPIQRGRLARVDADPRPTQQVDSPADSPPGGETKSTTPAPFAPLLPVAVGHANGADQEVAWLDGAHRSLRNDPSRALDLALQHERRFPVSSLDQERDFIAIQALVALGRTGEATRRADRLARQHPDSSYLRRIHSLVRQ